MEENRQLLSKRVFRRCRVGFEDWTPPPRGFRYLTLKAHGSVPRSETSEPIKALVIITDNNRKTVTDPEPTTTTPTEERVEVEVDRRRFKVRIPEDGDYLMWYLTIFKMLNDFNFYPDTYERLKRHLGSFLKDMAREARSRGFSELRVKAKVWQWLEPPEEYSACMALMGEPLLTRSVRLKQILEVDQSQAGGDGDCDICERKLSEGSKRVQLRCFHVFHRACMAEWLISPFYAPRASKCPTCYQKIFSQEEQT